MYGRTSRVAAFMRVIIGSGSWRWQLDRKSVGIKWNILVAKVNVGGVVEREDASSSWRKPSQSEKRYCQSCMSSKVDGQ